MRLAIICGIFGWLAIAQTGPYFESFNSGYLFIVFMLAGVGLNSVIDAIKEIIYG